MKKKSNKIKDYYRDSGKKKVGMVWSVVTR